MVRYWAIAPSRYSPKASFERIWRYDRDNEIITIGWDDGQAYIFERPKSLVQYVLAG